MGLRQEVEREYVPENLDTCQNLKPGPKNPKKRKPSSPTLNGGTKRTNKPRVQ